LQKLRLVRQIPSLLFRRVRRCSLVQHLRNPIDIQAGIRTAVSEAVKYFPGLADLSRFKVENAED